LVEQRVKKPQIAGDWKHIFNPNETRFHNRITACNRGKWYTNDHTLVKGPDGIWHAFGIIGYKVAKLAFSWIIEQNLFHITSAHIYQENWEEHDFALTADRSEGERFVWAPHVIWWENQFIMLYAVGDLRRFSFALPSYGKIHMATSEDGFRWQRHDRNPIIAAPGYARDPFMFFHNGEFYVYYTCNLNEINYRSSVAVRKSKDLMYYTGPKIVFHHSKSSGWYANNAESPFVVLYENIFYLFISVTLKNYNLTQVYWSDDPEKFPIENHVCDLPTHASEIIYDENEGWFITNTGWDKKGLYITSLKWI
jgi:hypothetical protein